MRRCAGCGRLFNYDVYAVPSELGLDAAPLNLRETWWPALIRKLPMRLQACR